MGPPSYVRSVIDRNILMRHITVRTINSRCFHEDVAIFQPQLTDYIFVFRSFHTVVLLLKMSIRTVKHNLIFYFYFVNLYTLQATGCL